MIGNGGDTRTPTEDKELTDKVGKPQSEVELLGISYDFGATGQAMARGSDKSFDRAEVELTRIGNGIETAKRRSRFRKTHVMPQIGWGAQWMRINSKRVATLRRDIEYCLRGD